MTDTETCDSVSKWWCFTLPFDRHVAKYHMINDGEKDWTNISTVQAMVYSDRILDKKFTTHMPIDINSALLSAALETSTSLEETITYGEV